MDEEQEASTTPPPSMMEEEATPSTGSVTMTQHDAAHSTSAVSAVEAAQVVNMPSFMGARSHHNAAPSAVEACQAVIMPTFMGPISHHLHQHPPPYPPGPPTSSAPVGTFGLQLGQKRMGGASAYVEPKRTKNEANQEQKINDRLNEFSRMKAICEKYSFPMPPAPVETDPEFPQIPTTYMEGRPCNLIYTGHEVNLRTMKLSAYKTALNNWTQYDLVTQMQSVPPTDDAKINFVVVYDYVIQTAKNAGHRIMIMTKRTKVQTVQNEVDEVKKEAILANEKVKELEDTIQDNIQETNALREKTEEMNKNHERERVKLEAEKRKLAEKLRNSAPCFGPVFEIADRLSSQVKRPRLLAQASSQIVKIMPQPPEDTNPVFSFAKDDTGQRIILGEGHFGKVFLCSYKDKLCALKRYNLKSYYSTDDAIKFAVHMEYGILTLLASSGIAPMAYTPARSSPQMTYCDSLIMELVFSYHHPSFKFKVEGETCAPYPVCLNLENYWSILTHLVSSPFFCENCDKEKLLMFIFLVDIIKGLTVLHAKGIIHGDLKPSNILLQSGLRRVRAVLCDTGSSFHQNDGYIEEPKNSKNPHLFNYMRTLKGREWIEPELSGPTPKRIDLLSDMFSFGHIVHESLKYIWIDARDVGEGSFLRNTILPVTAGKLRNKPILRRDRKHANEVAMLFYDYMEESRRNQPTRYRDFRIQRQSDKIPPF